MPCAVLAGLLASQLLSQAASAAPVTWTQDPSLVPWETMTRVSDSGRTPLTDRAEISARRTVVADRLKGSLGAAERLAAMVEMGDLFRDEARLVLVEETGDPYRVPLRTSPAWFQLECALDWYDRAREESPDVADLDEGRLTLLKAVTLARLGLRSEAFATYAKVIRRYRRTPYAEVAKLAVGDHHARGGDALRAKTAYGMVRNTEDPELRAYARYRLAHLSAAEGDVAKAGHLLEELTGLAPTTPLLKMVREGALSARANHLAPGMPLPDLVGWIDEQCRTEHPRCPQDLRQASADSYLAAGAERQAAWLLEVDGLESLSDRGDLRRELSLVAEDDVDVWTALSRLEAVCDEDDRACRTEVVLGLSNYYDELVRSESVWLRDYVRMPKVWGRSDINHALARAMRDGKAVEETLDELERLCGPGDAACLADTHRVLAGYMEQSWRKRDSAWVKSLDEPPPLPGRTGVVNEFTAVNRSRVGAREALDRLEPYCPASDDPCAEGLRKSLGEHYGKIGLFREQAWLQALGEPPTLVGRPRVQDELRKVIREDLPPQDAVLSVVDECPEGDTRCVEAVKNVLSDHYGRIGDSDGSRWLMTLPAMRGSPDSPVNRTLFEVMVRELGPLEALDALPRECAFDLDCSTAYRKLLVAHYRREDLLAQAAWVERLRDLPIVPGQRGMNRVVAELVEAGPDAKVALQRIREACSATGTTGCVPDTVEVFAEWLDRTGDPLAAGWLRAQAPRRD